MINYDRIAQAYEYEARAQACFVEECVQDARHIVGDNPLCCYHYSEETGEECDCYDDDYADAMAESAQGTYNGKTPAAPLPYHTACVGLRRRQCTNPARPNSGYCEACAPEFDALCDGAPPAPATPSPITITATPNGMYRLRYNSTTIGVCSADALEALRLYLADGMIAAYDDAMERIAALEGALEEIAALEDHTDQLMGITELFGQRAA